MSHVTLDPVTDQRWRALVDRADDAGIFAHPAWIGLLADQYRYPVFAVGVERDGELVCGLPVAELRSRLTGRRLVALPFSDVVTPVFGEAGGDERQELGRAVERECAERGLPLEVHGPFAELPGAGPGDAFLHHVCDIGGRSADEVFKVLHQSKRRAIRGTERSGVTVQRRTDADALRTFYRMHTLTRRRLGVPTQPRGFIDRFRTLFEEGLGFVLVAELDGAPVAAGVYLHFNGTLTMKYNASDPAMLSAGGNVAVYAESIRIACAEGCHALDYGRTELENDGLRRFKEQFGAEARDLAYTRSPANVRQQAVRSVPRLQQEIIRRSPPVVGRLVGSAFYRHVG